MGATMRAPIAKISSRDTQFRRLSVLSPDSTCGKIRGLRADRRIQMTSQELITRIRRMTTALASRNIGKDETRSFLNQSGQIASAHA